VAQLQPGDSTFWVTGTAAPCTSLFKPVWFAGDVLPDMGPPPQGHFNPASLWWFHEQFHRRLLLDFAPGSANCRAERQTLQADFFQKAGARTGRATSDITAEAFDRSREWTERQISRLSSAETGIASPPCRSYRRYWKKLNRQAGIHI
jgi:hypothetical protein